MGRRESGIHLSEGDSDTSGGGGTRIVRYYNQD